MLNRSPVLAAGLALVAAVVLAGPAAGNGTFEVLTYNVEGLPPIVSSDRTTQIADIATKLEARHQAGGNQIIGLQEVFHAPYHTSIVGTTTHANETAKTNDGPQGVGDGLTHLSDFASGNTVHNAWSTCGPNTGDCLTNKGYTFTRYTLETDVTVDVYNMHMDAGQEQEDKDARTAQFAQLSSAIDFLSTGRAVILMGDMNSRFTRVDDVVDTFVFDNGFTDSWAELGNGGVIPGTGADIDGGCPPPRGDAMGGDIDASGPTCELIDKIMYRSGDTVALQALSYEVLLSFVDGGGVELADHLPVATGFSYSVVPEPGTAGMLLLGLMGLGVSGRRLRA